MNNSPENTSEKKNESSLWSATKATLAFAALCMPSASLYAAEAPSNADAQQPAVTSKINGASQRAQHNNDFPWGAEESLHASLKRSEAGWKLTEVETLLRSAGYQFDSAQTTDNGSRPHVSHGSTEVLFSKHTAEGRSEIKSVTCKLVADFTSMDHPNGARKVILDDVTFQPVSAGREKPTVAANAPVSINVKLSDETRREMIEVAEGRSEKTIRLRLVELQPQDRASSNTGITTLLNDPSGGRYLPDESRYSVGSIAFYPVEDHPQASSYLLSLNDTLKALHARGELDLSSGFVSISTAILPINGTATPATVAVSIGGVEIEVAN